MTNGLAGINLKPIGFVRNEIKKAPGSGYNWKAVTSRILIDSYLTEALDNLDEFSHIIVIYWMHQVATESKLSTKTHPRGKPELPLVGLFATRSPNRPNPLGKTTVRLLKRRGNILYVQGLDAIDGTPVVDIKPYIPDSDSVNDARVPPWVTSH